MAEGFQKDADFDAHSYFGGQLIGIDYEEALRRKKEDPTFKSGPRKIGKAINFSLPGGVGPKRFAAMSLALYKAGELEHPISLDEARVYKEKYLEAYPEMALYFRHIELLTQEDLPLKQFVSNRVRRSNRYTALANSYFQGLAADLAKRALWYVTVACYAVPDSPLYGSRVVAFVHDEIICEIPEDRGHEGALEIQRLMVLAANEVAPDVPFTAEPALMRAWIKKATDQYDANGRLVPWKCKKCGCDTGCAC
jgi:DNA polymerase I-like protein with 3'-5' exonuclease and polymerase domains